MLSVAARDSIVAIATPPGSGGIGVLRVSGPEVRRIAQALGSCSLQPRYAEFVKWRDADGSVLDAGLQLYFPAPHSYTGEDVLELHAHGNPLLLRALLARCVALGARLARPGEFTERAFLEGRLDLTQAEAVADLIDAQSQGAVRAAQRSLNGAFSRAIDALLSALTALRVQVEAAIDFPEEEIDFLGDGQIQIALEALCEQHQQLLQQARNGQRLRDGLHVAIVGPPNAGKSSLLNALAGEDRAIVSAVAGTTRDVLRETLDLDGITLTLADTAGLRDDSLDPLEHEGMRRARAEHGRADLVLAVVESGNADAVAALQRELATTRYLLVHNKIDLLQLPAQRREADGVVHIDLSARGGQGLDLLRAELRGRAGGTAAQAGSFSARQRHVLALQGVGEQLDRAREELERGAAELVAERLRLAQQQLGEITGRFLADDLLGAIFSSFCIGK